MEPKFQTSFIPKGNFASVGAASVSVPKKERTLLGYLALMVFVMALVGAAGVFGYARYLSYSIGKMGDDLTTSRNSIEPETVNQLISADARMTSTKTLLASHTIVSPIFAYLEVNTLKTVRFTELNYSIGEKGVQLLMKGEARGYQAVALQSDAFNRGKVFKNPLFSDLRLDDKGNVTFSFSATVDPAFISFTKSIEKTALPPAQTAPAATTTAPVATSTTPVATTTRPTTGTTTNTVKPAATTTSPTPRR